jgi:hypothetical protein
MQVGDNRRDFPGPSRRQIWITVVLMGALLTVGIVLLVTQHHGSRSTLSSVTATATTVAAHDTLPIGSSYSGSAVALELALRSDLGGCWDDAEPGGTDGAYRQDFHFPTGSPCGGDGWDVDIELFDSNGLAAAAGPKSSPGESRFRTGNILVVVAASADPNALRAVESQPGLERVSPKS